MIRETSAQADIADGIRLDLIYQMDGLDETISRVHRQPPGPWRSLGQHLDYTDWPERDRFVYLDREIKKMPVTKLDREHRRYPVRVVPRAARRSKQIDWDVVLAGVRRVS
jgi:hypothetical protein